MPDKSQNIFINYKFNTADVERATATLNRANQASNILGQTSKKAGEQAAAGFKKAGDTTKTVSKEVETLTSKFGGFITAVKTFIAAGLVRELFNLSLEMSSLKGETEGVERAFKRAFPNSVAVLKSLRDATHGTINDLQLMQRTLKATNLGLAVESLPRLFEFAAARAQQTGESVDYLVDSIVNGIGRKSVLVLDNLGISSTRLREKLHGVSIEAANVGDVTKAVGEIAEEELGKIGGFADTAKTSVDRLRASFEGLRQDIAKKSDSSGFNNFLNDVVDGLRLMVKGSGLAVTESARVLAAADAERIINSKAFKEFADNQESKKKLLQGEVLDRIKLIGVYQQDIDAKKAERRELGILSAGRIDDLQNEINALEANKTVVASTILILQRYIEELNRVNETEVTKIETISNLSAKLKELKRQREEDTATSDTAELDRLQREIILLEDRILKISDNIEWQKQWDHSKETSALATANETELLKKFNDELDKLTDKFSGGSNVPTLNFDNIESGIKEVADLVEMTKFEELGIRIRLFFNGEGLDSPSQLQQMVNDLISNGLNDIFDASVNFAKALTGAEADQLRERLDNLRTYYSEQQALAGDNEKAKDILRAREKRETAKLREQIAAAEKKAKRNQVIIDIAAGIAKAFAEYIWPYSLIPAAAVAAEGAIQLAAIDRTRTSGFAKGVIDLKGPGTSTSDSIPARLSKGESVMTAWETRNAGEVLEAIRAKKLDNRVLKELKQGRAAIHNNNFDDSKIIKAIEKNRPPDIIEQSGIVYEVRQKSDTYRSRQRAKSIRI